MNKARLQSRRIGAGSKGPLPGGPLPEGREHEDVLVASGAASIKLKIARELKKAMVRRQMSKAAMAKKLKTSRPAIDRLLEPSNMSITLNTMAKVAHLLGKRMDISLK